MYSAWDFIIQSCLKTLRKAVKQMAAQQNNHRTHGLLSFMLNDHQRSITTLILSHTTHTMYQPEGLSPYRTGDLDTTGAAEWTYIVKNYGKVQFLRTFCSPCLYSSGTTRLPLLAGSRKLTHSSYFYKIYNQILQLTESTFPLVNSIKKPS